MDFPLDWGRTLVGGEIVPWRGRSLEVLSPIYVRKSNSLARKSIGSHPGMTGRDALRALETARRAFSSGRVRWPSVSLSFRIGCAEKFLDGLSGLKDTIITTLMWEIAKPYHELEDEFERTIGYIRQVIKVAGERENRSRLPRREKGIVGVVRDEPHGVALCLGPYNYPLFETLSLVFPALLAGNTVIVKPPKFGVLFFDLLLESFRDCFPPGAVNVISGDGRTIVEPLMKSGEVDVFAFIGSPLTANRLLSLHPRKNRLRSLLGLGAKNAVIILPDADLDRAVRESVLGALAFNGQRCAALKIFFVHHDIREAFGRRLRDEIAGTRIGMPWTDGVRITPLADPERILYLHELVENAVDRGAAIGNENGGTSFKSLFSPTILEDIRPGMKIYDQEQFGPIIPLVYYRKLDEPIRSIVRSRFGQQLSIFGTKIEPLAHIVDSVRGQVARININTKCQRGPDLFPFSGRKDSAQGDFSTPEILNFFSAKTVVAARENGQSASLFGSLRRLQSG
jgi:glyceraldehyde-3-phosphate dehydrogenase (NADP+)